eukprot:TRINITY_DN640_c0_g1_i1.p1 TRINITY_DN640_c0_g1~~TRINITY_DN640_c0_g1_i1.p1  ORF type:complete len:552 (-),score=156.46 TRINITY_DN640_c0_g1_i1:36-1691(-)
MKKKTLVVVYVFVLLLTWCCATAAKPTKNNNNNNNNNNGINNKIKHVFLIVLENRSFDHVLGFLRKSNPNINGLFGNESNPYNPLIPNSPRVTVNDLAPYFIPIDPHHDLPNTTLQLFGYSTTHQIPPMDGFIYNYYQQGDIQNKGADIMKMFNPSNIPAITTLASNFAIFDAWYASIPGPTFPNRLFINTATSHGATIDSIEDSILGYPQKTLYDSFDESGYTWRDYYGDIPSCLMYNNLRDLKYADNYRDFSQFHSDSIAGDFATFNYVEPRFENILGWKASDEHPTHDVILGEHLLAHVYNTLRHSTVWNQSAIIVTFDEHGGFFDHVPPPQHNIPVPDNSTTPEGQFPFDWKRLGVRVPTIVISPWVNKGVVVHSAGGNSEYEHSSIAATMKKMFGLKSFLTKRDEWAASFEGIFEGRKEPRTDCPETIPVPEEKEGDFERFVKKANRKMDKEAIREALEERRKELGLEKGKSFSMRDLVNEEDRLPLSDFQRVLNGVMQGITLDTKNLSWEEIEALREDEELEEEWEGALFAMKQLEKWRAGIRKP